MAKKVRVSAGGEKHVVYKKTTKRGKGVRVLTNCPAMYVSAIR